MFNILQNDWSRWLAQFGKGKNNYCVFTFFGVHSGEQADLIKFQ